MAEISDSFDTVSVSSSQSSSRTTSDLFSHSLIRTEENKSPEWQPDWIFLCRHCKSYGTHVHTNFRKHFEAHHQVLVSTRPSCTKLETQRQLDQLYRTSKDEDIITFDKKVFQKQLNHNIIDDALVRLIAVRRLPLRLVEWPEFHTFCQVLNPESKQSIIQSHGSLPKRFTAIYEQDKAIVRSKLQAIESKIHISLDVWTAPNRFLLLGVCAHYMDRTYNKAQRTLLALREIRGHTAQEQFEVLITVLKEYDIVRSLGTIIGDNASSNDKLCRMISTYYSEQLSLEWNTYQRIRCLGHVLNLVVQAYLFYDQIKLTDLESYDIKEEIQAQHLNTLSSEVITEQEEEEETKKYEEVKRLQFRMIGALGKLHNIVIHIRSSAARSQQFKRLAGKIIPLDNRTRWNSWYTMLSVALDKESAVDSYIKLWAADLQDDELSLQDWQQLRTTYLNLQPFYEATITNEGYISSIGEVLPTMFILRIILNKHMLSSYDTPKLKLKGKAKKELIAPTQPWKKAYDVFTKYLQLFEQSPIYLLALLLSPTRRLRYFNGIWKDKTLQEEKLNICKAFWAQWRKKQEILTSYDSLYHSPLKKDENLSEFQQISRQLDWYHRRPQCQDELEDFVSQEPYDISPASTLSWWNQETQKQRFPQLSTLAHEILSIPAMSDEPERIFSAARRTISWERAQIKPIILEQMECIKYWTQHTL
jgi:hypothetical protein